MKKVVKKGPSSHVQALNEGFEEDFQKFINSFEAKSSYEFKAFAEVWNELNFNLIYSGRETVAIVEELNEEIAHVVLKYLLSENSSLTVKICAIYMMYGIHQKQPCGIKATARIVQKDVPLLKNIKEQFKFPEYVQVQYVLCCLLREGFFRFVMTERAYGLEKPYRKYIDGNKDENTNGESDRFSTVSELDDLFNSDDIGLDVINRTLQEYHRAKSQLPGSVNGEPPKELQLVNKDIIDVFKAPIDKEETLFLGKKEAILKKEKQKIPNKNTLHKLRESYEVPVEFPSTSQKKNTYKSKTYQKELLLSYCEMHNEDEIKTAEKMDTDNDPKHMPSMS